MEIKITDRTKETIEAKNEAIERAFEIIGGYLERYAKQSCPVDTGLLRNSITYCLDGKHPHLQDYDAGGKQGAYDGEMPQEPEGSRAVFVGTNVEYASIVEFNEKARHTVGKAHFIRDSLANHIGQYQTILKNEMNKG